MSKLSTLSCATNILQPQLALAPHSTLPPATPISSFNQSNINTPPIKLMSAPKFIQNIQAATTTTTTTATAAASATTSNTPPMSVTYAFMKNSQVNRVPVSVPVSVTAPAIGLNTQPKFLMSSNHHQQHQQQHNHQHQHHPHNTATSTHPSHLPPHSYPIFAAPLPSLSAPSVKISPPPPPPLVPCTTNTVNKSPQAILDELPRVFAIETRLTHNRYVSGANPASHSHVSPPSSPPESVCSRMSDTSIPSLIRQDITVNKSMLQNILKASQPQQVQQQQPCYSNSSMPAPANDFKALFSKLNKTSQPPPQHQYPQNQFQVSELFLCLY